MTIFIQVVKDFLIKELNDQITKSRKNNTEPGLFGISLRRRDTTLSETKIHHLQTLITAINSPDSETDQMSINQLCVKLEECKKAIAKASADQSHLPGSTEALLTQLMRFLTDFYATASELRLIDKLESDGTFTRFLKAICTYYAHQTLYTLRAAESTLTQIIEHPILTNIVPLHQALDAAIKDLLLKGYKNLENQIKKNRTLYSEIEDDLGQVYIDLLIFRCDKLSAEYTVAGTVSSLPPYLKKCLTEANCATIEIPEVAHSKV